MRKIIFAIFILGTVSSYSQEKNKFIYLHLSDKSVSLTPFYKPFGASMDPAITLGGGINYFQNLHSSIFQVIQGTWYSAKMIGGGITLSSSMGYQYRSTTGIYAEFALGIAGTGFISGRETFILDENGQYGQETPLHWTLGVPIDLGLGYQFAKYSVYCKYRYMLEGTYADILPILPSSLVSLGFKYSISRAED